MGQERAKKSRTSTVTQILLKADTVSLVLNGEKDGKIRARASAWEEPVVILAGQVLEVRNQAGQVVLMRREGK